MQGNKWKAGIAGEMRCKMQKSWHKLQNIYLEDFKTGRNSKIRKRNKRYFKRKEKRELRKVFSGYDVE